MALPRIIVVIPAYNEQDYLGECLDCLARQTCLPDHVIVVDNNSTDATAAIAQTYRFVSVVTESQQGICAATKTGFDTAARDCDIILRCDADSRPPAEWVASIALHFSDETVAAATGPGTFYELGGFRQWLAETFYMRLYFSSVGRALGRAPLFGSNCAVRASAWLTVADGTHLNRQDIHDDIDLSYHLLTQGRIIFDAGLIMPISARPFSSVSGFAKRLPMGFRSILIHWPAQAPWRIARSD